MATNGILLKTKSLSEESGNRSIVAELRPARHCRSHSILRLVDVTISLYLETILPMVRRGRRASAFYKTFTGELLLVT